jgi:hypothetical protein
MIPVSCILSNSLFSDNFDEQSVDCSKWVVEQNPNNGTGGSITLHDSYVYLTSYGTTFPYLHSSSNPFPETGDFSLEFDIQYSQLTGYGSGIWISRGTYSPQPNDWWPNIFHVWGGNDGGINGGYVQVLLFSKQVYIQTYLENSLTHVASSDTMIFRLQYSQGIYTVYLNGKVIASGESELRADTIGFGYPPNPLIPVRIPGQWTSTKIDSIRVLEPTILSISNSPSSIRDGKCMVEVNGKLTDIVGTSLSNAPIVLSYQIPNTATWNLVTSAITDSGGNYNATWFAPATGFFIIKAEWMGDEVYGGTFSCANVSVTNSLDQMLLLAESNSTLSSLAFNSTLKEISFTVSGETGTTGYVRFCISNILMLTLDFKVYLDGNLTQCKVTSQGNFTVLYFEYHHSLHNVIVKLPIAPAPITSPAPTDQPSSTFTPSPSVPEVPPLLILFIIVILGVGALMSKRQRLFDY